MNNFSREKLKATGGSEGSSESGPNSACSSGSTDPIISASRFPQGNSGGEDQKPVCGDCGVPVSRSVLRDFKAEKDSDNPVCPFCLSSSFEDLEELQDIEEREGPFTCSKGGSSHRDLPGGPEGSSEGPSRDLQIRRELKKKLVSSGFETASASIDACGNATIEISCNDCGHVETVDHHCDNRVCDKCGSSRWKRTVEGLKERIFSRMDWNDVRFMTLTVKNTETLEKSDVQDLRDAFKKLKRREFFDNRIDGGVYSIESNFNGDWNLHLHVVYQGAYIPQERLSDAWADLTGCPIVDVRKSKGQDSDAEELAKYITKQPDVSGEDGSATVEDEADRLLEYHKAMYRTNLIQPFGIFHHSSDKAVSLRWANLRYECPECGSEDIDVSPPPMRAISSTITSKDPPEASSICSLQGVVS